jgi:DtxR family Mn-dependent transcriptional regulator
MKLTIKEEDYLETIYRLSANLDSIRISDIARSRGVTMPTVISAISRLKESGMVNQSYYGKVYLTAAGKEAATEVYETHSILRLFFGEVLGLSMEASEENACKVEHGISREVIERLKKLIYFMRNCSSKAENCRFRNIDNVFPQSDGETGFNQ